MANENKLQDIIRTSLENIKNIVDANTVIGSPISLDNGTTIVPISKVSVGFASGGVDYNGKQSTNNAQRLQNFGGGGGTGISVSPVGFLVIGKDGQIDMVNIGDKAPADPVAQVSNLLDRTPEILSKIKAVFVKDKSEEKDSKEDSSEE
jgi:sporulation protein YtfJ